MPVLFANLFLSTRTLRKVTFPGMVFALTLVLLYRLLAVLYWHPELSDTWAFQRDWRTWCPCVCVCVAVVPASLCMSCICGSVQPELVRCGACKFDVSLLRTHLSVSFLQTNTFSLGCRPPRPASSSQSAWPPLCDLCTAAMCSRVSSPCSPLLPLSFVALMLLRITQRQWRLEDEARMAAILSGRNQTSESDPSAGQSVRAPTMVHLRFGLDAAMFISRVISNAMARRRASKASASGR